MVISEPFRIASQATDTHMAGQIHFDVEPERHCPVRDHEILHALGGGRQVPPRHVHFRVQVELDGGLFPSPGVSDQDILSGVADRARRGEHDVDEEVEDVGERKADAVASEG